MAQAGAAESPDTPLPTSGTLDELMERAGAAEAESGTICRVPGTVRRPLLAISGQYL